MNINPITGAGYAGQATAAAPDKARQPPPPPPPDGQPPGAGGFVNAIGEALSSFGVTDVASSDKESAAAALGSFLQELMGALHAQGEAKGAAAEGKSGHPSPGRLSEDLQGLISSLQADDSQTSETSSLEGSFSSLLEALGANSSDAHSKLAGFLQALAGKLPQAGSSGNLIHTTA